MDLEFRKPFVKILFDTKSDEVDDKFRSVLFSCGTSIYFRDLMLLASPGNFKGELKYQGNSLVFSEEYKGLNDDFLLASSNSYEKRKDTPIPMAAFSEYQVFFRYNDFLDFLGILRKHNSDLWSTYGNLFLESMKETESVLLHKDDKFHKHSVQESEYKHIGQGNPVAGSMVGVYRLANSLVSQIASYPCFMLRGELFNKMNQKSLQALVTETDHDLSVLAIYMSRKEYISMVSDGCCFLSSWDTERPDSWAVLSGSFAARGDVQKFLSILPCKASSDYCPYKEKNQELASGKGDMIPCPIFLEFPDLVSYRIGKFNSTGRVSSKWQEAVSFLKDNVRNSLRQEYVRKVISHENIVPITEAVKKQKKEDSVFSGIPQKTNEKLVKPMQAMTTDYSWGKIGS